jgi:hypothetical protein
LDRETEAAMNKRRERMAWLVALAVVTALASAPSLLTAFGSDASPSVGASAGSSPTVLIGADMPAVVRAAPQAVGLVLFGLVQGQPAGAK